MLHSGSRAIGPAIRDHHVQRGIRSKTGLIYLPAESEAGERYLRDVRWALEYADSSRVRMVEAVIVVMEGLFRVEVDRSSYLSSRSGPGHEPN